MRDCMKRGSGNISCLSLADPNDFWSSQSITSFWFELLISRE